MSQSCPKYNGIPQDLISSEKIAIPTYRSSAIFPSPRFHNYIFAFEYRTTCHMLLLMHSVLKFIQFCFICFICFICFSCNRVIVLFLKGEGKKYDIFIQKGGGRGRTSHVCHRSDTSDACSPVPCIASLFTYNQNPPPPTHQSPSN